MREKEREGEEGGEREGEGALEGEGGGDRGFVFIFPYPGGYGNPVFLGVCVSTKILGNLGGYGNCVPVGIFIYTNFLVNFVSSYDSGTKS